VYVVVGSTGIDFKYVARGVATSRHAVAVTPHPAVAMAQPVVAVPSCCSTVLSPAGYVLLLSMTYWWIAVRMESTSDERRASRAAWSLPPGFKATKTTTNRVARMVMTIRSSMRVKPLWLLLIFLIIIVRCKLVCFLRFHTLGR